MKAQKPTRPAAFAKAGDTVRCIGQQMTGVVLRVVKLQSNNHCTVQWPNSVGRHTITTLEVVSTKAN